MCGMENSSHSKPIEREQLKKGIRCRGEYKTFSSTIRERLTTDDIKELMGIHRDIYTKRKGRVRRK